MQIIFIENISRIFNIIIHIGNGKAIQIAQLGHSFRFKHSSKRYIQKRSLWGLIDKIIRMDTDTFQYSQQIERRVFIYFLLLSHIKILKDIKRTMYTQTLRNRHKTERSIYSYFCY